MVSSQPPLHAPMTVSAWAPFLDDREIEEVQNILIHCNLTELSTLLASVDPIILAGVDQCGAPSLCLWKVLHRFNRMPRTAGGELPLEELLATAAVLLGGRAGAARLQELREKVLTREQELGEVVVADDERRSEAPVSKTLPPQKRGLVSRLSVALRARLRVARFLYAAHAGWFHWAGVLALIGAAVVIAVAKSSASHRTFDRFEDYADAVAQLEAKATEVIYLGDEPTADSPSGTTLEQLLAREDISMVTVLLAEDSDPDAPRWGALRTAGLAYSEKLRVCGASRKVFGMYSNALPPGAVAMWMRVDGVSYLAIGGRGLGTSDVRNEIYKDVRDAPLAQAMLNAGNRCTKTETIAILSSEKATKMAP